ncbi:unnamed protein product [Urochloa humidicola]
MASSWDKLGQAASIMQVTGIDAFGLVSMIIQAAHTAHQNRDMCQQLAQHVQIVGDLLRKLDIPELRRHPETRRPLEQLDAALFRAYKLVRSCSQYQENRSQLYQIFTGADVASKLRLAQEEIDRYINLIPMISLVAVLGARGTQERQEDVTIDPALGQRPPLSLEEVNESLALEERPTTGVPENMEARRNGWHLVINNVRNSLVGWRGRHLTYGVTQEIHLPRGIRSFSYDELWHATNKFSDKDKMGNGGLFGGVFYRGFLKDQGLQVAIQMVTSDAPRSVVLADLTKFCKMRHPNLLHLVGFCLETPDNHLFVYELPTNGFLYTHLHDSRNMLTWPIRYRIILGIGSALLYLHQEAVPVFLHRDITPATIMLDSYFNAKLVCCPIGRYKHSIGGTWGYVDPTFVLTGVFGPEADIYSFGVVLLHIACGPRPIASHDQETKRHLVHWVWELYGRDALLEAADARLKGDFEVHEMKRVLILGLWCMHPDYKFRPSIDQAMKVLRQSEAPLPDLPLVMPH